MPPRRIPALAAATICLFLAACSPSDRGPATIWTDVPELAIAAELFNASQQRWLVVVQWKADLADALGEERDPPALAVGRYLKSASVRDRFQSLDYLFGELIVNQSSFYPELLSLGNIDGRQLLLPVSFNLPAIVFAKDAKAAKPNPLIDLEEISSISTAYNKKEKAGFVRMGFSPRWNADFLALVVNAAGAGFREGKPLSWSDGGLKTALDKVSAWVAAANGSPAAEDDFQFKYLYTPPYQYVATGRALFAYMDSASFFHVPEDKRSALAFRWFSYQGQIPVSESVAFAAILHAGKGKQAAEAFVKWFFKEDDQRAILEAERRARSLASCFGVAGGFSSVRSVNEKVFPQYYPSLAGRLPPADALAPPGALPSDWAALKAYAVAPYLVEATRRPTGSFQEAGQELAARIADYRKKMGQ
jgi:ABC-type glycerol-3-phosphate transport system substrate-binding protein